MILAGEMAESLSWFPWFTQLTWYISSSSLASEALQTPTEDRNQDWFTIQNTDHQSSPVQIKNRQEDKNKAMKKSDCSWEIK